jgi:hypothetical protein
MESMDRVAILTQPRTSLSGTTGLGRRVVSWLHWGCLGSFLFLNSVPPDDASSLLFGFFRHSHVEDAGSYA